MGQTSRKHIAVASTEAKKHNRTTSVIWSTSFNTQLKPKIFLESASVYSSNTMSKKTDIIEDAFLSVKRKQTSEQKGEKKLQDYQDGPLLRQTWATAVMDCNVS